MALPGFLKRIALTLLLPVIVAVGIPAYCDANSPPTPSIFIIVHNAPKDLKISLGDSQFDRRDTAVDSYFGLLLNTNQPVVTEKLTISTGNTSFQIDIPPLTSYTTTFTLDLTTKTLTIGASKIKPYGFAVITIILTLLIEGTIFYLFGYRKRASWIVFFITNFLTQGFLYVMLFNQLYPSFTPYFVFQLIFGEFWVFVIEIAVFLSAITERNRWLTFAYVIVANWASLILGGILINALI